MDIYGVKKYKLEQVFLDINLGISKTHVYKSITIDRTSVSLDMTKVYSSRHDLLLFI